MEQVFDVLRIGAADGKPYFNDEHEEWRLKMTRKSAGQRVYVVATIDGKVLVVTIWKD